MKKIIVAVVLIMLVGITNVSAMTESELRSKVVKSYKAGNITLKLNDHQVSLLDQYLEKNELTGTECDYISNKFDEVIEVITKSGVSNLKDLSESDRNKLSDIASDITNNTRIKVVFSSDGVIYIYNTDGTLFTTVSSLVKQTGSLNILYIAGAISIIGASYFALRNKKTKKAFN